MARTLLMTSSLIDIFHKIENGGILVPNFSRGFVWRRSLVKQLVESIYLGYPIGTILVVRGKSDQLKPAKLSFSHFPELDDFRFKADSTLWVIDGLQRLIALYGSLKGHSSRMSIYFDLVKKEFILKPKPQDNNLVIKMSDLFDYKAFMELQEKLFFDDQYKPLIDILNQLHRKFQDYQVPLQIIEDVDEHELFDVFSRINGFGQTLTKQDLEKSKKLAP